MLCYDNNIELRTTGSIGSFPVQPLSSTDSTGSFPIVGPYRTKVWFYWELPTTTICCWFYLELSSTTTVYYSRTRSRSGCRTTVFYWFYWVLPLLQPQSFTGSTGCCLFYNHSLLLVLLGAAFTTTKVFYWFYWVLPLLQPQSFYWFSWVLPLLQPQSATGSTGSSLVKLQSATGQLGAAQ